MGLTATVSGVPGAYTALIPGADEEATYLVATGAALRAVQVVNRVAGTEG